MELKINGLKHFGPDVRDQFRNALISIITQLSEDLELKTLEYIIVTEHFGKEVNAFQRGKGLREEYTDDDTGRAFGKTLSYNSYGALSNTIFLDENMVFSLTTDYLKMLIHLIHHELCHVHDEYLKSQIFGLNFILRDRGDLPVVLIIHADAIWSEYIATRLSFSTVYPDSDCYIPYLQEQIGKVKETCHKEAESYNINTDLDNLYSTVQLSCFSLLRAASMVAGYLHGFEALLSPEKEGEIDDFFNTGIRDSYFASLWVNLKDVLREMYRTYPRWKDESVFNNLSDVVLETWNLMGIYPMETGKGLEISVNID